MGLSLDNINKSLILKENDKAKNGKFNIFSNTSHDDFKKYTN